MRDDADPDRMRQAAMHAHLRSTVADPGQPWWWRKIIGPAMVRVDDALDEQAGVRSPTHEAPAATTPHQRTTTASACPVCERQVPVATSGKLIRHMPLATDVIPFGDKDWCAGSPALEPMPVIKPYRREPRLWPWVLLEIVAIIGGFVWGLYQMEADPTIGAFIPFLVAVGALAATIYLWMWRVAPNATKALTIAVGTAAVVKTIHSASQDKERTPES